MILGHGRGAKSPRGVLETDTRECLPVHFVLFTTAILSPKSGMSN